MTRDFEGRARVSSRIFDEPYRGMRTRRQTDEKKSELLYSPWEMRRDDRDRDMILIRWPFVPDHFILDNANETND